MKFELKETALKVFSALAFYADSGNYSAPSPTSQAGEEPVLKDGGARARESIQALTDFGIEME